MHGHKMGSNLRGSSDTLQKIDQGVPEMLCYHIHTGSFHTTRGLVQHPGAFDFRKRGEGAHAMTLINKRISLNDEVAGMIFYSHKHPPHIINIWPPWSNWDKKNNWLMCMGITTHPGGLLSETTYVSFTICQVNNICTTPLHSYVIQRALSLLKWC